MALKNTKIARDIVQTCNKLLSNKSDITSNHKASENAQENLRQEFRYDVSNTSKCSLLPKIELQSREPKPLTLSEIQHLQPAIYPKHIQINANAGDEDVWHLHKMSGNRKFEIQYPLLETEEEPQGTVPAPSQPKHCLVNGTPNIIGRRNYSTSPFITVSRAYAKAVKDEKCHKPKKKEKCHKGPCPSLALKNCTKSAGSDCNHSYIDPKCTKKYAPYPSYSETCAQELEDDPSECYQCPWSRCGGTDDIKPPKRQYHTSTRPYNMAMVPTHKPCQAPPPKCQEQKKKKPDDCPGSKPKKRKCSSTWIDAYRLWCDKENIIPSPPLTILENVQLAEKGTDVRGKFPFDKRQADYEYLKQKVCENEGHCKKKKFKRVPESCDPEQRKKCLPNAAEQIIYELSKCPTQKPKCPPKGKRKCPEVNKKINIFEIRVAKEHDKGKPPPCSKKIDPSEPCKEKPRKVPYKRERDMHDPYYRKNPKPYPPQAEH